MATQTLSDLALDHYSDRQKLVTATQVVAGQMWSDVDPKRIVESWAEQVPELTAIVSGAQLGAARPAASYTDEALAEQDVEPAAAAEPNPAGFAGQASDGGSLVRILTNPVFVTLANIQDGFDVLSALSRGRHSLTREVSTQVADAGRLADQVTITSRKSARGYIRLAVGNSCARCLLLAGREYRWSEGFKRHDRCDCIHIPAGVGKAGLRSLMPDPEAMYARMTRAERIRAGFTLDDQMALADGADLNQVVNARHRPHALYTAGGQKLTRESTTRRGVVKRRQRLSVDECYRVAAGDRDEALALLRSNGYLFDGGPKVVQSAIPLPVAADVDPALKMTLADLKAIARQNNVPLTGLTKKSDVVGRLREFETANGRIAGLPEFTPKPIGPAPLEVKPLKAPNPDFAPVSGQGFDGWSDLVPERVPTDGLRAQGLEVLADGGGESYVVRHGTVFRDPDGVAYLIEHGPDEYASQKVARILAEMRQAHATIPAAARANKSYAYLQRKNPYEDHFRVKYKNPNHESSMSAREGHIVMWRREQWPRVNTSEVRHETGHNLDHLVGRSSHGSQSKAWKSAAEADAKSAARIEEFDGRGRITPAVDASRDWPAGVTDYGKSTAGEDYAESVMMYQLGPIARGRMPGEASVRDLYFRDLFPGRAKILDREFPEIAREQVAAIEALRAPVVAPRAPQFGHLRGNRRKEMEGLLAELDAAGADGAALGFGHFENLQALKSAGMVREVSSSALTEKVIAGRLQMGGSTRWFITGEGRAELAALRSKAPAKKVAKAAEITPEQRIRDLLAGKGTAPKILTTGPTAGGYAGATLDELRVLAESRYGHLGKIAPKATREQLLAALRSEMDLTDGNVFKREAARLLQLRVERGQALADVLGEAAEMVFKRATPEAMRRNIEAIARSVATARTPVPPAFLRDVLKAVESGDRAKVEAALRRIGQKYKIRLDGMAGDISKAREGMEFVGGPGFREGVEVRITRPGAVIELPNGETARLRTTVVREVDAQERARIRQEAIDEVRKRADVLTEVSELVANGADRAVIRERLGIRLKRAGLESDADLKAFIRAVESGDPAKIAKASQAAAKKLNLTQVDEAGLLAAFDPKKFQAIAGSRIGQGAQVRVVRPGFEFELKGERITLSKPVVEELSDAEIAEIRQQAVDAARGLVDLQAELAGGPAQRRIAIEASALPDDVKATLLAASKVSPAKLKSTLAAQMKKSGVTVGKTPKAPVKFDPKLHEVKGGAKLPVGTKVRVVEPEVTVVHRGETVVVRKGVVEPVAPVKPTTTGAKPVPIRDLFEADDATIEAAIRDVYEGKFGPYTTKVTVHIRRKGKRVDRLGREIDVEPSISVSGRIYDAQGHEIGDFGRTISPVEMHYADGSIRTEVWANHSIVQLEDKYQGRGFGGEFNRRAIDWYRSSGVHGIGLSDHNGYVWASQGFGFRGGIVPEHTVQAMRELIADLRAGRARNKFGEVIPKKIREASDLAAQIEAAEELLARLARTRPGEPGYPTAYEISQLGRRAGQKGKTALWLGRLIHVSAEEMIL